MRKVRKSICPLMTSATKRRKANKLAASVKESLPPGLARPALRALAAAGIKDMKQLARMKEAALRDLHGIGPSALGIVRDALKKR